MRKYKGEIKSVLKSSQLWDLKIRSGDFLLKINGQIITDLIDYQFAIADEELEIEFMKKNGKVVTYYIELEEGEDLGIEFSSPVFDSITTCYNKCIFCFVKQLPRGLRHSLYLKDDDYRLSFLYGNFITMTNINEEAMERIKTMHLSPLYISIHTTNSRLRKNMLKCPKTENVLKQIEELIDAGITLHTQIVVVPGINDGVELSNSIEDLSNYYPQVASIGVVPVGTTKFRENDEYYPFDNFTKKDAKYTRDIVESFQKKYRKWYGESLVYLSDEIYLTTGGDFPPDEYYDDYPQYENGIGITRSLFTEVRESKYLIPKELNKKKEFTIITGTLAFPVIKTIVDDLNRKIKELNLELISIKNNFFGKLVTVTGLICGCDIIEQVNEKYRLEKSHKVFLIPDIMLNNDITLDDMSLKDIEEETGFTFLPFNTNFKGLLEAVKNY